MDVEAIWREVVQKHRLILLYMNIEVSFEEMSHHLEQLGNESLKDMGYNV